MYEEFAPRPNRLLDAHSAYLRSAAYQPIGWFEYGPEAFAEAQRQDKPILLDIGAAWCHWCHVIDRESYEDPEIATLVNELFIPVKVDRDERPDIDARYQTAVQVLTGTGGWPLTVFLTPDGTPFFGGTYFPPTDRGERVGLQRLLPRLSAAYRNHREELQAAARALAERAEHAEPHEAPGPAVDDTIAARITEGLLHRFNPAQGGFEKSGPKFPHPAAIELALRQWDATGDVRWRVMAERTLLAMGLGGIYDQLGGGFHRYAVDAEWRVPHFEKMAYDNALLLENYAWAYRALGVEFFRVIAEGTLEFLLREMSDVERGGFYAAQDADVGLDDDGSYWTWSLEECIGALTAEEAAVLLPYYGVQRRGEMPETGRNVLRIAERAEQIAARLELPEDEVLRRIAAGKRKLLHARRRREAPRLDTTKYANLHGLLVSALLQAGTLLDRGEATTFALRSVELLLRDAYDEDRGVYHLFQTREGALLPGLLEDQVYVARALLDAFSVSGDPHHLAVARRLLDLCLAYYWDEAHGGFQDVDRRTREAAPAPFLRQTRKIIEDMPTPSPNAVAARLLNRLWLLTGEERYHDYAGRTLRAFSADAPGYGPFAAAYGLAIVEHLTPPVTAIIVGDSTDVDVRRLWDAALATYRPGRLVACFGPDAADVRPLPALGRAAALICGGQSCSAPIYAPEEVQRQMLLAGTGGQGPVDRGTNGGV